MTDEEILKKAVQVAYPKTTEIEILFDELSYHLDNFIHIYNAEIYIYSHDFAKAFWGEEYVEEKLVVHVSHDASVQILAYGTCNSKPAWQYHLQQLVLCENPLGYIKQFLEKGTNDR